MQEVDARRVKEWLSDGEEIAFLDVREHGQYGEGHPFLVVSAPYSRLEQNAPRLVPRLSTRIVLLDSGDGVSQKAAHRLEGLGYGNVHVLKGGVAAWVEAGYGLFQGVNLPSKTFGELVEHHYHTPSLTAQTLKAMQERGEKLLILDGRPRDEHFKMAIPGSICCPNGELAYRIHAMLPDDETTVVVHCAGRTRSIIGAQMLVDLGLPNPVYALENGTQGWYIADFELDHKSERAYPDVDPRDEPLKSRRASAQKLAARSGVPSVGAQELDGWQGDDTRTTYLLDVRTPEEVAATPLPGAHHAPGGQLLQGTDQYVGTRKARLVIIDTDGVRAPVVASWLKQMGHDVYLLAAEHCRPLYDAPAVTVSTLVRISPQGLAGKLSGYRLIDLRPSASFRKSHIAGAQWSVRPLLSEALNGETRPVVFAADDADTLGLALSDLPQSIVDNALWLEGQPKNWQAAGLDLASMADFEGKDTHIDYLFFVHDRHDGNKEAAKQYLAWELGLIEKLDEAERGIFKLHS